MLELLLVRLARVDGGGRNAQVAQVVNLVLHERNEGRDHEAQAGHGQRGHLESDALATSRGHEAQGVVPRGHTAYDVGLYAAKRGVAPVGAQQLQKAGVGGLACGGC